MTTRLRWLGPFLLTLLALSAACGGGDDDAGGDDDVAADDTGDDSGDDDAGVACDWSAYDPRIEAGIAALADRDPAGAAGYFAEARALCPDVADAEMGLMLAGLQELLQTIPTLLGGFGSFPDVDWAGLQRTIRDDLLPLNAGLIARAAAVVSRHPEARLFIPSFPLWTSGDTVVVDGGGEWDWSDALNVLAIADLIEGVERFLVAFNLEANWGLLTFPGGYDPVQIAHELMGKLLEMFADPEYPDFLKFAPGGEADFAAGAIATGFAAISADQGFVAVRGEVDPQEDDVTAYVDADGDGRWERGEVFRVPYLGVLSPTQNAFVLDALALMEDLGPALLDGGPSDLFPGQPNWLPLSDLNFILELIASYVPGLSLPPVPVPVGRWFYHPSPNGIRDAVQALVQALYDLTAP